MGKVWLNDRRSWPEGRTYLRTMGSTRSSVISLYKRLVHLGREYPDRPEGDSTVPREGRLHCQGAGGSLHAAQIQDHEEQILRLVDRDRSVVMANLNLFFNE